MSEAPLAAHGNEAAKPAADDRAVAPMSAAWPRPRPRLAWGLLGVLILAVGVIGAWFSTRLAAESKPAAEGSFVFRAHEEPRPLAELGFGDGGGRKHTLSDFRGKLVLLNIWATWCVPCREEMPALDRLQRKLGGPSFEVLALSIDAGGAAAVKSFYDEVGVRSLAVYVDPAMRVTGALGTVGVPTTPLVDRDGREVGRHTGPARWDGPEAVSMIEGYLKRAGNHE